MRGRHRRNFRREEWATFERLPKTFGALRQPAPLSISTTNGNGVYSTLIWRERSAATSGADGGDRRYFLAGEADLALLPTQRGNHSALCRASDKSTLRTVACA